MKQDMYTISREQIELNANITMSKVLETMVNEGIIDEKVATNFRKSHLIVVMKKKNCVEWVKSFLFKDEDAEDDDCIKYLVTKIATHQDTDK